METYTYSFRRLMLPYCIEDLGEGWFLFLNRRYKPIGQMSDDWVDYTKHPSRVRMPNLTPKKAEALRLKRLNEKYYLYDDVTNPEDSDANWKRYSDILQKLSPLKLTADR
ncbi:hypothetical protein [Rhizobium sp. WW_1]|jgi:hypothetical protein|uniref:hypothetical protein n=1 Tax=Rhizobium sp. WW_1 TaxID=1907375 RepID=UPI0006488501|nr:hypothetical protein [Rhizobium sp. WW_1]RKD68987.1 hypothetical protein BJ928_104125 [Rhizobium sp. WW_1]